MSGGVGVETGQHRVILETLNLVQARDSDSKSRENALANKQARLITMYC